MQANPAIARSGATDQNCNTRTPQSTPISQVEISVEMLARAGGRLFDAVNRIEQMLSPVLLPASTGTGGESTEDPRVLLARIVGGHADDINRQVTRLEDICDRLEL